MKIEVIDFYADWCIPCKDQDLIIEELKKIFQDKVEFRKVDIDKNKKLSIKYNISAIPTIIIEENGKFIKRYVGTTSIEELEEYIKKLIQEK